MWQAVLLRSLGRFAVPLVTRVVVNRLVPGIVRLLRLWASRTDTKLDDAAADELANLLDHPDVTDWLTAALKALLGGRDAPPPPAVGDANKFFV